MSSWRKKIISAVPGFVGGLVAGILVLPLLARTNFFNTGDFLANLWLPPESIVTKIEEKTIIVPSQDVLTEAAKKAEPSVAGIQSFSSGRLIRSGSGVVLTQDGLIATLVTLVPAEADFIQAVINGSPQSGGASKIYQARVVSRDYRNNLALISIPANGLPVIKLQHELPKLGQHLLALGKIVAFGKDNSLVVEPLVARIDAEKNTFAITMDFNNQLYSSALIDGGSNVLGLVDFRNQGPVIIFSKTIESVLNAYLSSLTKAQ